MKKIADWQRKRNLKILEKAMGSDDFQQWEDYQTQLKIDQLFSNDMNIQFEAIKYCHYMDLSNTKVNVALHLVICNSDITNRNCIEAIKVLSYRLNHHENGGE
jgi:hypothetical protein